MGPMGTPMKQEVDAYHAAIRELPGLVAHLATTDQAEGENAVMHILDQKHKMWKAVPVTYSLMRDHLRSVLSRAIEILNME